MLAQKVRHKEDAHNAESDARHVRSMDPDLEAIRSCHAEAQKVWGRSLKTSDGETMDVWVVYLDYSQNCTLTYL